MDPGENSCARSTEEDWCTLKQLHFSDEELF